MELTILCITFVLGGELAQDLGLNRVWSFLFTFLVGLSLFSFRRALGDHFGRRLIRFLRLPSELRPQIFRPGKVP